MTRRVRVSDGWSVYVDGTGQVGPGTVVQVDDDQADEWIARGWVEPGKTQPKRATQPES